ncbi:MAG: RNA 2',3'-cyclic phosphodiesterase [Candidatus Woesearchaeota archaeon]
MRLFIAIDCSELKGYFSKLQQQMVPSDARLLDTFHLTLLFLGEQPETKLELLTRSLKQVSAKPFRLSFDHMGMFTIKRKRDIFWVGVQEKESVVILQRQITRQLKPYGVKPQKRFIPHVTIARRKRFPGALSSCAKRQSITKKSKYVDSFKLMQSTLTPDGPVYTVIKEFKL